MFSSFCRLAAAGLMIGTVAACGGSSAPPPAPTPVAPPPPVAPVTPVAPALPMAATITITATGVSPHEVAIALGGKVTFVNSDSRPHDMTSDPQTTHADCPATNQAAYLVPGQSRDTGVYETARSCGFHDHVYFDPAFAGTIEVREQTR